MGDRTVEDLVVGVHVEFTNGPAGEVRHVTRYSPYRVMLTLDSDPGDDSLDLWRVGVRDRQVVRVTPQVVWPDL